MKQKAILKTTFNWQGTIYYNCNSKYIKLRLLLLGQTYRRIHVLEYLMRGLRYILAYVSIRV